MPDNNGNGDSPEAVTAMSPDKGTVRETRIVREEHVADSDARSTGLIDKLFDRMPSWQRSLLLLFIIPPMTLALSGVLLQVNVGGIMNRYIDYLFESAKQQTRDIDKIITERIHESTGALQGDLATGREETAAAINEIKASVDAIVRELSASNARADAFDKRLAGFETRVGKIERYICDSDGRTRGLGTCVLDEESNAQE